MSNIITKGYKGLWKIITRGYYHALGGKVARFCRVEVTEGFICKTWTD